VLGLFPPGLAPWTLFRRRSAAVRGDSEFAQRRRPAGCRGGVSPSLVSASSIRGATAIATHGIDEGRMPSGQRRDAGATNYDAALEARGRKGREIILRPFAADDLVHHLSSDWSEQDSIAEVAGRDKIACRCRGA
jgi:hypothetical protein